MRILAMGGGGFSMEPENLLLDEHLLSLTGKARPRVLFVPTASGDADGYIVRFYQAFAGRAEASHLGLFRRTVDDLRALVLAQDVVYVGGGNTANMLGIWRTHGLDTVLAEAWRAGVILAGVSAGAVCWFEACVTDSFGGLAPLRDGLGLVAGSFVPHYDGEPGRRPTFHAQVGHGVPDGWAADDGAALWLVGTELVECVASRPEAAAYRVERDGEKVVETRLPTRWLGATPR